MWFDARAKLAEIAGHPPATSATTATQRAETPPRVAIVASVATPPRSKPQFIPPARADGLDPDAGAYLDRLRLHGPQSYGAMASTLCWRATRAWQAEAKLRAAGLVQYQDGKAVPKSSQCDNITP
jgi:hypothetical protein